MKNVPKSLESTFFSEKSITKHKFDLVNATKLRHGHGDKLVNKDDVKKLILSATNETMEMSDNSDILADGNGKTDTKPTGRTNLHSKQWMKEDYKLEPQI
ncbi:hypothetical protein KIN20_015754 [Parelaphostrongylus tenuis]|uniref:Uncharacterized protein n=1 Tax=Parelaphostrongylus tenuis TaxID=148309 RepID=A0AAD5MJ00_PARTN|nr:hypothetical protein KIN20_015754 [Parelaphostrongylus tenuis]